MVKKKSGGFSSAPDKDTGWGLIFRLNKIFEDIERVAPQGKYDEWNFLLDRLYINVNYKDFDDLTIVRKSKKDKKIVEVKFPEDDFVEMYKFINEKVKKARSEYMKEKNPAKKPQKKEEWYIALMVKDSFLRKVMQDKDLYLKEVEYSPGRALFGGYSGR